MKNKSPRYLREKKTHTIMSIEKTAFEKIQYPFSTGGKKTHDKLGNRSKLNLIKGIYKNPTADIILSGEGLKAFPFRSGTKTKMSFSLLYPTSCWRLYSGQTGEKK